VPTYENKDRQRLPYPPQKKKNKRVTTVIGNVITKNVKII
jgi:hypothetical protein